LLSPPKWSQASLSLPPASAELAEALAGGENLAEFAERTGLSIGGARTRLKKLLRRLGVRSQSDLVAVLLRTAAALPVP
jgi:DNA-binding CsgD family transcriptional regulator